MAAPNPVSAFGMLGSWAAGGLARLRAALGLGPAGGGTTRTGAIPGMGNNPLLSRGGGPGADHS
jgi:hypothetical protein